MLPAVRQSAVPAVSRASQRAIQKRYDAHIVQLAEEQFVRDSVAERLHGGSELVALAGSLLGTMALAEASLAAVNPAAACRVNTLIDSFTLSAADVIDAYMRRPV